MDRDLILSGRRTIEKERDALTVLLASIDDSFARVCEMLFECKGTILLTGMGKSGLVARKWASTLCGTGTAAVFLNPAEASHGDLGLLREGDVLVALSLSGETEELGSVLRHARESGVRSIGVTGKPESSLGRQVALVLSLQSVEEACPLGLAPTSTTTAMMALGDAVAITLMEMRGFTERDFARLHPGGTLGRRLWLRVGELMHRGDAIPRVTPSDKLEKILVEMTRKRLGLAVVLDGETVVGIITDGDLRRFFQREVAGDRMQTEASALMTRHPKSITADALAVEARELMERASIQQLLVSHPEQGLVGVLHLHDLLRAKVV